MTIHHLARLSALCLILVFGVVAAQDSCGKVEIGCGIHGTCHEDKRSCSGDCFRCKCDKGWDGDDCSLRVEICEGPVKSTGERVCFHGGTCVRDHLFGEDSKRYKCDCSTATNVILAKQEADEDLFHQYGRLHVGHQCEFRAEVSCEPREHSTYAFCTNGGTCIGLPFITGTEDQCNCPSEFEGRHCQYKLGTKPDVEPYYTVSNDSGGRNNLSAALIAVLVFFAVAITFWVGSLLTMMQKQRQSSNITDEKVGDTTFDTEIHDGPGDLELKEEDDDVDSDGFPDIADKEIT